jgi:hypothetical protein
MKKIIPTLLAISTAFAWQASHASVHTQSPFKLVNTTKQIANISDDDDNAICDKKYDAHCARFDGKGLKFNMCKPVRVDKTLNDGRIASIECMSDEDSVSIEKESIGKGKQQIQPGTTLTDTYSQCSNLDCSESKVIGIDSYTINADKTSTPFETKIPIDVAYGETYDRSGYFDDVSLIGGLSTDDSCTAFDDPAKTKFLYCAGLNSQNKTNKYVKITETVANTKMTRSVIMCASPQTHFGYMFDVDHESKFGAKSFTVSQCDDFACKNPKLIGKDTVTLLPNKTVDHTSNSFTIDPTFGEDCSPLIK